MTHFEDKAPNKLAENRSALSTPDPEESDQVFSTDDFRPNHSLTFGLCSVFRIGPHKRACGTELSMFIDWP